ncbi:Protein PLANT CADMIUM RESISTANCE 11 [Platanthera zijinensis]|uniref:Protein PLANT CADMIUM RESISTANCE 11 n=1 Tax=Platanthera zijinensis TaxID=2320716 RepID=A0AAP0C0N4_9ASPA
MTDYKHYDGPQVAASYPASAPPPPMPGYQPQGLAPWSPYPPPMLGFKSQGCLTFCCPCITFGRIVEIVDRGSSSNGLYMKLCMYFVKVLLEASGWGSRWNPLPVAPRWV